MNDHHQHPSAHAEPEKTERVDAHHGMPERPEPQPAAYEQEHVGMDHSQHNRHPDIEAGNAGHAIPLAAGQNIGHADHGEAHADHTGHEQMFRRRFWVSLVLSLPVILYSSGLQMMLGLSLPAFPGSRWLAPVFGLIVFIYGGLPFLQLAVPEIKNRQPGMMTLISLAISVAFLYSAATLFLPGQMDFFWELVTLIDIMLLGHWIEMRSVRQASGALNALAKLMPDTAELIRADGSTETVAASQLRNGERILIRPGAGIPADGEVLEGESSVNEAMITGESRPINKAPGARVIGGAINGEGSLRVQVTATGNQTALAGIMRLVEQAQQSRSRTQILADKAAGWLFYIAIGVAVLTAIAWTIATGFNITVIERVATVLVIACPHALGLAIPLVVAITTSIGAANGILVRDRLALEKMRLVDTVLFDKTGTLTEGRFGVVAIAVTGNLNEEEALALAAAVEGDSEHTIARAIRESAVARNLTLPTVNMFEAIPGRGAMAHSESGRLYVGGPRLLEMLQLRLPERLEPFELQASGKGHSVVHLLRSAHDGSHPEAVASFAMADVVRPESRAAVRKLHEMGVHVAMLTGDSAAVAKAVAEELGIDTYFAEVLPQNKDAKVNELQSQGKTVAMVGDGVNDAPALTRADVGIAIGSGTDVAVESAGIILVRSNPLDIVKIITLSRASYRKMIQNLVWAAGYNVVALPLAAGVLAPVGILLSPAIGAILMSVSTVIVAINAQLLRKANLT
ncbi:ATPase, P-type (transporting), HAD superfamily, subfamily IC [Longilinea arvoryzae]|uniref:ATPase, P-type (Transporting), HAD superfamily, subfamily IC n=1 Tax=Longilinea arvoryzae TaxID=360412 RepID=A0A0S7BKP3_9CHLR|nr:heavy metal translocating P-type ATPase [Longilinea arvoryzae]GAP15680.1 ATPase, P-type (transporting), HAD superfamily, subfamily IC [Longilinea arvoryzae]